MNQQTQNFLEELKNRQDVVGVILFGSWARGNNRPNSDVDLIIILEDGYQRCVEYRDGQVFEIVYTNEKSIFEFWQNNKDVAFRLWSIAKILFDRDGRIQALKEKINTALEQGKKSINKLQLEQYRFSAEDSIVYVGEIYDTDQLTAKFLLYNEVDALVGMFFDIRQIWTPAPKQILGKIKEIDNAFYDLLVDFYDQNKTFNEKLTLAKQIVKVVFG